LWEDSRLVLALGLQMEILEKKLDFGATFGY
jgi:hypothetical protein